MLFANQHMAQVDEIMHVCDMFEATKKTAQHERTKFVVETESDLQMVLDDLKMSLFETFSKEGYVVFMQLKSEDKKSYQFMKNVNTISIVQHDRLGWALFKDVLNQIDVECKTDERMIVVGIL